LNIKIKVLIIEDEPAIARGLAAAISRHSPDFDVTGIYRNGREGLDAIITEKPQMVFTDIRMPVMDGLDMIEKAVKLRTDSIFIILSGYEQFEYARTALSLGVIYYLLKPVNVDELNSILIKFKRDFYVQIRQNQLQYLQSVLYNEPHIPDFSRLFIDFYFTVLAVYLGPYTGKISLDKIPNLIVEEIEKKYDIWVYVAKGKRLNECICILVYKQDYAINLPEVAALIERGLSVFGTFLNIVISEMGRNIGDLGCIVAACENFATHHNAFGTNKIAYCTSYAVLQNIAVSPPIAELCFSLPAAPIREMLLFLCKEAIRVWKENEITQEQLLIDIRYIMNQAIQKSLSAVPELPDASEIINGSGSFEALMNKLTETIEMIFDIKENIHEKKSTALIEKVKQYLDNNFTKVIVYKNFYDVFGYNEKYIALLFKTAYGISPSKYVIKQRIELAKQIMRNNRQVQIMDVSAMVGISDSFYFSRIFKHYEGLSPSEYLRQYTDAE
jgi:YesN/AraC family two-component response regulator